VTQERPPRRSRQELQLLAIREILRAITAALPLDEILSVIANMAVIVADATSSWLMLAEDGRLRTVVARGELAEELLGQSCETEAANLGFGAGELPLVLESREIDPADPVLGALAKGEQPVVLLPLKANSRALGLLGVAAALDTALEFSFLSTLAEQAAAAIESARLRDETRTWRERLDAVFERMAEAVLVFSREGRLALMNASAEELLGDRSVQMGDSVAEVVVKAGLCDPLGRPEVPEQTAAARALRGERVENLEVDLPAPGHPARHLLVSAVPLRSNGQIQGAVVVWRDVTYVKELGTMRAEFLSMVSHELRSPLTSVLGFAQLLRRQLARGEAPRDIDRRLEIIVAQTKRINALVEDLLDVSRAEGGRLTLRRRCIDLPALIQGTVQDRADLAPDYCIRVELPAVPARIQADPGRIEQVLRNLLSNAVKFSAPGTEITARLQVLNGKAVVSVADQGLGIAREDIGTLFMPFHRIRQVRGREAKGIGLGLFISRSIVEAHGGEIWVHSQLGKGSTFYFALPLAGDEVAAM